MPTSRANGKSNQVRFIDGVVVIPKSIKVGETTFRPLFPEVYPPWTEEEFNEHCQDMQERGMLVPVVVDDENGVIDGINRLLVAQDLGWSEDRVPWDRREGLTDDEKCKLCKSLNHHRRHATPKQRRQAIKTLLATYPEKSDRQIAEQVGASHVTVGNVRAQMESTGQIVPLEEHLGKDGVAQPASRNFQEKVKNGGQIDHHDSKTAEKSRENDSEVVTDAVGQPVPRHVQEAFANVKLLESLCRKLDGIKHEVKAAAQLPGGRCVNERFNGFEDGLAKAKGTIWANLPYAVCPYCKGENAHCEACQGEGWVPKHVFFAAPGKSKYHRN